MKNSLSNFTAVILAGGKSSRMGSPKALLSGPGNMSFLETTLKKLSSFEQVIISAGNQAQTEEYGRIAKDIFQEPIPKDTDCPQSSPGKQSLRIVKDIYENCGPMGALHTAFKEAGSEYIFTIPCDLPDITMDIFNLLKDNLTDDSDAVVPKTSDGKIHPLCAIFRRSALAACEEKLKSRDLKVLNFLSEVNTVYVEISCQQLEKQLLNLNTTEEYKNYIRSAIK